jgi:hypothetical protein
MGASTSWEAVVEGTLYLEWSHPSFSNGLQKKKVQLIHKEIEFLQLIMKI